MESFTLNVLFKKHLRYYERFEKIPSEYSYLVKMQIQIQMLTYQKQLFDSAGCSKLKVLIFNILLAG